MPRPFKLPETVTAKLNVRVLRGHAHFWSVMRELKEFTVTDIEQRSDCRRDTIRDFVQRLAKGGYLEVIGTAAPTAPAGTSQPKLYRLVREQADAPSLRRDGSPTKIQGIGQDHLWRAIKMAGTFTYEDLAALATTDTVAVTKATAKRYVTALNAAGYLAVVTQSDKRGGLAVYRLIPSMNTGPQAPEVRTAKVVYDPNLAEVMTKTAEAVCDG